MPCLTEQCRSVSVSVDLSKKKERELFADVMLMSPLFFTCTFSGFIPCCPRSEQELVFIEGSSSLGTHINIVLLYV